MPVTPFTELTYRDDFSSPHDRASIYALLRDVFGVDVSPLGELDLWEPTYRAFAYLDENGTCVANAATFTLRLMINDQHVNAMGIQSVATRTVWRGRGLSHALLERALQWCDTHSPLTFLMTSIPGFYEPMGFRGVPQSSFIGDAPVDLPSIEGCRLLDLDKSDDRRLVAQVLRRRSPVSGRFSVVGSHGDFLLTVMGKPGLSAWHITARDAVVVTADPPDGRLCIVDVAAPKIPLLAEILAALNARPRRVEVHFPPDYLGWTGAAVPAETPTVLMVRGDPGQLDPFMLPETAAF